MPKAVYDRAVRYLVSGRQPDHIVEMIHCLLYRIEIHFMIKSFRHRGIERFFRTGSKAGIQPKHASRLRLQLGQLDAASGPNDMDRPGWRFHALKGDLKGHCAVWVDENWRLTFKFEGSHAELVDYQDYH